MKCIPNTPGPVITYGRRKGLAASTRQDTTQNETTMQRVYSTRRSARLTGKKCAEPGVMEREVSQPLKIDSCLEVAVTSEEDLCHSVPEKSVEPALRSAILAFRREEELQGHHASKRRRERLDQDKSNYNDPMFMNTPRGRGIHVPLSAGDRVVIKGNKRTPERFVGSEAVVTTQCLNGWYVVKMLDNAESIKVQYRSLAKVSDNTSSQPSSSKMTPNWL